MTFEDLYSLIMPVPRNVALKKLIQNRDRSVARTYSSAYIVGGMELVCLQLHHHHFHIVDLCILITLIPRSTALETGLKMRMRE